MPFRARCTLGEEMRLFQTIPLVLIAACAAPAVHAHPVPRRNHDRTIAVHLQASAPGRFQVMVDYRLEVDPFTLVYDDIPALSDKIDLNSLRKPHEFYDAFLKSYAPILARNLLASLDGQPLEFTCAKQAYTLRDEQGVDLGHLRCDFVFMAPADRLAESSQHRFSFREGNYELEEGLIRLSLDGAPSIRFQSKAEPDAALKARPATELKPGDDAKLRKATATFEVVSSPGLDGAATTSTQPAENREDAATATVEKHSLLALLLDSQQGLWVLLFLAAVFGAAHALTPGHGKTLVAAYLVGERGTVSHALILGLVTTLTHTGVVLALAAILLWFFPKTVPRDVQVILGLVGGLLVAGMGLWLLLRRVTGAADHVHLGGAGHHHHHGPHGHQHDLPLTSAASAVGWWSLIVLGISGGIVPCWDAIVMLGLAISAQRLWLGLPLLLAFSAGLASVLIAIGIAVVYVKGFASSHWGESRLIRALPIFSAVLVTAMGLWLCYDTVHTREATQTAPLLGGP